MLTDLFYYLFCAVNTSKTAEDDMKPPIEDKKRELLAFYTHHKELGYNLKGCT